MNLAKLIVFCALLQVPKPIARIDVFLPTSEVLHIAEMAARDEGFDVQNKKLFFFDLQTTADGKEIVPGYVSMGFYGNGHPIHVYSINKKTAQVVDIGHCEIFLYRDLISYAKGMNAESGRPLKSREELADEVGCATLRILDKSNPTPKQSRN